MPALGKFPLSKPRFLRLGVFELHRSPPGGPVTLRGLPSECVPILSFPEGTCRVLSHLGAEGGSEVCTLKNQGGRHVASGQAAGAEPGGWARGQAAGRWAAGQAGQAGQR